MQHVTLRETELVTNTAGYKVAEIMDARNNTTCKPHLLLEASGEGLKHKQPRSHKDWNNIRRLKKEEVEAMQAAWTAGYPTKTYNMHALSSTKYELLARPGWPGAHLPCKWMHTWSFLLTDEGWCVEVKRVSFTGYWIMQGDESGYANACTRLQVGCESWWPTAECVGGLEVKGFCLSLH